jgi:ligand-binding sensor domain-containing protein
MRFFCGMILSFLFFQAAGQFPYVKKLNYPEQLPTQVVYDMLTDTKGYIWLGTDKGLYRFNGRTFIQIPFDNTSSKAVSYLQEDSNGKIWCMNFYNQLFYYQNDSLIKFSIDNNAIKEVATFNNVVIGSKQIWFHSFKGIYEYDKTNHRLLRVIKAHDIFDPVIASVYHNDRYFAFSNGGYIYADNKKENGWVNTEQQYTDFRFISHKNGLIGIGIGLERAEPFEMIGDKCVVLPEIDLPDDIYLFQGLCIDNSEYWLCTQNGAYKWNKQTGEIKCFLPNERVTDVVKDYQGNYWFSTLDDGVFVCSSLYNTLIKIYEDPLSDNYTKLQALPNGEVLAGNSQGLLAKLNLENRQSFEYSLPKLRETEFIRYDTTAKVIITNRGVFKQDQKEPVELLDYNKGVERDRYGNLLFVAFNGGYVMNDKFNDTNRFPQISCPLYEKYQNNFANYSGMHSSIILRPKRGLSVLSSADKDVFWIGYEDGLYEYNYNGTERFLKDEEGKPVVAKSLQQQYNGDLVVASSTRGVMIFRNGKIIRTYTIKDGLSSVYVRKVLKDDKYIWVLTDDGLDRIDATNGTITNYLEEYGLTNTIINDFIVEKGKIIFATPTGILIRYNVPRYFNFEIRFPMLKANSNGISIQDKAMLPENTNDITFYFEALHYISTTALAYQYRLKGIDTIWRSVGTFNNQLTFNRLSPGKYIFEIKATAGTNYKSVVRSFAFVVPKPFWQKPWFLMAVLFFAGAIFWLSLRRWKSSLLKSQMIKEHLLKSQLVALRAQMNPHFLYNVLNTVQGLVYGNRKTEAGELLGNFSDLMRKTLQASDKQLLSLKDEIENLRLYLELEKARFDGGFEYRIETVNIDDLSEIFIPSLLLQPFAENSVKHGLMHKPGEKKVDIFFEKTTEGLRVVIDDNGIGRIQSMEINKRSKSKPFSFATAALTERMDLFNRLFKQKITCEITDKLDDRGQSLGTRIELIIPDYSTDPHAL